MERYSKSSEHEKYGTKKILNAENKNKLSGRVDRSGQQMKNIQKREKSLRLNI